MSFFPKQYSSLFDYSLVCKSCEHEIVFVLICTLAEQCHVRKSYKMRESTLSCIGNFEENIDPSHIYLAV